MGDLITDQLNSAIKHDGNFFIMDSEQLVCNPFQDLQLEAIADAQKKTSMTERLTSVKNNVCENHLLMARSQLQREEMRRLKLLHDSSSRLRYEVKLLDLDRQKHVMETKKRMMPEHDHSYEELQLSNTEKRLGANVASFYLQRRMRFPPRLKSVSDIRVTPTIRRAREALKLHGKNTATEGENDQQLFCASLPSSARLSATRADQRSRAGSRSAPAAKPCSDDGRQTEPGVRLPLIGDDTSTTTKEGRVKFVFEDPLKILMAKDADADHWTSPSRCGRPATYHPHVSTGKGTLESRDFRRHRPEYDDDDEGDNDDHSLPDYLDLRSLLFGAGDVQEVASPTRSGQTSGQRGLASVQRRTALRATQDLAQQESQHVQGKVDRFLHALRTARRHAAADSDDEDDDDEAASGGRPSHEQQLQHLTTVPVANQPEEGQHQGQNQIPSNPKDAWKYIRGRGSTDTPHGAYTTEELVLQALTGVPVSRALLPVGVPFHCAQRALRHTPTYKMRQVVERLVSERTRYQQHEVQELRKLMEGEEGAEHVQEPEGSAPVSRDLEVEMAD